MIKNLNCVYTKDLVLAPTKQSLQTLQNLVQLHDPNWSVDQETDTAKMLLQNGVITLRNGDHAECYPFLDLVIYKLPPILMSNNQRFMRAFKGSIVKTFDPLVFLEQIVKSYYMRVKKKPITHF